MNTRQGSVASTTATSAVFISSRNSSHGVNTTASSSNRKAKIKQQEAIAGGRHHRDAAVGVGVNSTADAARAMNSISFINILCAQKNTADVRTYTQKSNTLSSSSSSSSSWPLLITIFRKKHEEKSQENSTEKETSSNNNNSFNSSSSSSSGRKGHTAKNTEATISIPSSSLSKTISSHETVAEYTSILWFLPRSRGTIKFEETIRVQSMDQQVLKSVIHNITMEMSGSIVQE